MLRGSCHCGAVKFEFREKPEWLTECNCSACRRYGTIWAHGSPKNISIEKAPDATSAYIWGDQMIEFHTCRTCGNTTHWSDLDADYDRMAVNTRLVPFKDVKDIPIRHFDGADTGRFLD
ncbi:aldehyde-activating protein [Pseudovibrio japonicus]|uniref:Aldehyde-activating protein n=1 Tax=Pseudovibrio japonicus TaxID=366534 RepID=A0ABQ3DZL2_9HYPH|nr:GFA family protein [Pseudovibrio japonicus]GHB18938.1 aldehyde-activating protein [Pseudovibrio japonicus]